MATAAAAAREAAALKEQAAAVLAVDVWIIHINRHAPPNTFTVESVLIMNCLQPFFNNLSAPITMGR